jgi:hypothetical protein
MGWVGYTDNLHDLLKAVMLQAWGGPEGSRKLSFPDLLTMAQDGGKVSYIHIFVFHVYEIRLPLRKVQALQKHSLEEMDENYE